MPDIKVAIRNLEADGISATDHGSYGSVPFVGPDIVFEPPCVIQGQMFFDGPLSIGAFSGIFGSGRLRRVTIGRYCSIAPGFQSGWDEHPTNRLSSSMAGYAPNVHGWGERFGVEPEAFRRLAAPFKSIRGQTVIGNDVWIGYGVFVRSGVTIGDGAIIGAGSYVMKDVPPYTIVGGNRAEVIRPRFSQSLIDRLLSVRWWRFNIFQIPVNLLVDPAAALDWIEEQEQLGRLKEYTPEPINLLSRVGATS